MSNEDPTLQSPSPEVQWQEAIDTLQSLRAATGKVIIGQDAVIDQILVALLCNGHSMLEGVPGLAKTLLVSTLGKVLGLDFQRIQFTPDLMPTDIVGSEILQSDGQGGQSFEYAPGPIFANLILADEINRTPPKTQAALLEAMQEKQVTVAGKTRSLEEPFIVFATQNPIEHEGTYPLPEAQLDRFFFHIVIDYPSFEEEDLILQHTTGRPIESPSAVLSPERLIALQQTTLEVPVPAELRQSILKLVHASRPGSEHADEFVNNYLSYGAGPRASQCLLRATRGLALLRGQSGASVEELREVAAPVLRHRLVANYNATGEGIGNQDIIDHLLKKI